jgi:hypothetical protein
MRFRCRRRYLPATLCRSADCTSCYMPYSLNLSCAYATYPRLRHRRNTSVVYSEQIGFSQRVLAAVVCGENLGLILPGRCGWIGGMFQSSIKCTWDDMSSQLCIRDAKRRFRALFSNLNIQLRLRYFPRDSDIGKNTLAEYIAQIGRLHRILPVIPYSKQ